jgi:hypothetical protein
MKDSTSTNYQGKPLGSPKLYQVTPDNTYNTTASKNLQVLKVLDPINDNIFPLEPGLKAQSPITSSNSNSNQLKEKFICSEVGSNFKNSYHPLITKEDPAAEKSEKIIKQKLIKYLNFYREKEKGTLLDLEEEDSQNDYSVINCSSQIQELHQNDHSENRTNKNDKNENHREPNVFNQTENDIDNELNQKTNQPEEEDDLDEEEEAEYDIYEEEEEEEEEVETEEEKTPQAIEKKKNLQKIGKVHQIYARHE